MFTCVYSLYTFNNIAVQLNSYESVQSLLIKAAFHSYLFEQNPVFLSPNNNNNREMDPKQWSEMNLVEFS